MNLSFIYLTGAYALFLHARLCFGKLKLIYIRFVSSIVNTAMKSIHGVFATMELPSDSSIFGLIHLSEVQTLVFESN
jgi:hypothetical protein